MKNNGVFNKNLIVYDDVLPNISIHNNKDKFIIKGNSLKQMVSLVFIINDDKYLNNPPFSKFKKSPYGPEEIINIEVEIPFEVEEYSMMRIKI